MAPKKRQQSTSIIDRLFQEYYRFSFFQTVYLLECFSPDKKPLGSTLSPDEEAVRFLVKPSLSFPPSEISHLKKDSEKEQVQMEVAFMGVIGPSGVLPYWYNELALERVKEKDYSLTDFLNIFHHRLVSLFYLAWKKNRLNINYQPGARDRISRYLLSLIGLGTPGLSNRLGLPEESLIYCSGLLSKPVPSAVAIESAVGYLAGTKVQVDQFLENVIALDPEDQTCLGSANSQLGVTALCGSYIRENQTKFRVNIGAMNYTHFIRFLPSGDLLRPIFSLIQYMVGIEYEFEVRAILKHEEVPLCALRGVKTSTCLKLGWSTWLTTPGTTLHEDPYVTFLKV